MIILHGRYDFEYFYNRAKFAYNVVWMESDYGWFELLLDLHILDDCHEIAKLQEFATVYNLDICDVDDDELEDYYRLAYFAEYSEKEEEELWDHFLMAFGVEQR